MANRTRRRATASGGRLWLCALAFATCLLALEGCRTTGTATSQPMVPTEGNAELMQYIGEQPFVTAEAGYRAAYILWKGEVFEGDFGALTATLADGGVCGATWDHSPGDYLDRQTVGYLLCRACGIGGGINWRLTGLGRYAWRELQYKGIAGPGGEWGLVSGGEFQGMLVRADDYMYRTGRVTTEKADLGAEP